MRANLPLRLTRAAAFSAVCVLLAALGHVVAGGDGPPLWALALGGGTVMALALALSGKERSTSTINLTLLGLQAGLHELFAPEGGGAVLTLAHGHGPGLDSALGAGLGPRLGEDLGMLLAHLTATLITGWWLARGEAALWSLLRRLGHRLVGLLPAPATISIRRAPVRAIPRVAGRRAVLRHIVSRRGPPLPAV
ncbi:MFS transporter [Nonomuraea recticatena]|uniref:MFS transporter n=1 Tax=Nonomuraea recticatena TaxID=46178 RepID=A0ABN3R8Q4_9ACTN